MRKYRTTTFQLCIWGLSRVVFAAATVASVFVTDALAAKPATRSFEFVLEDEPLAACAGFDIIENSVTVVERTIFFDNEGNRARIQLRVRFEGTFKNSVTGESLTDAPDPQLVVIDSSDGSFANHGLTFHITAPGEGNIVVDAGTVVIDPNGDVTIHGPHTVLEDGYGALCAAIAH
jgi:hypothetical protein